MLGSIMQCATVIGGCQLVWMLTSSVRSQGWAGCWANIEGGLTDLLCLTVASTVTNQTSDVGLHGFGTLIISQHRSVQLKRVGLHAG